MKASLLWKLQHQQATYIQLNLCIYSLKFFCINHSLSQDSSDSPSWYAIALKTTRDVTDDVGARLTSMYHMWLTIMFLIFLLNKKTLLILNILHVMHVALLSGVLYRMAPYRGPKGGSLTYCHIFKMAASITRLLKPWTPR